MISENYIVLHEIIGLKALIVGSTNRYVVGSEGIIIDESMHMITLRTKNGIKSISKLHNKWKFFLNNIKSVMVDGSVINKRSVDRLTIKC